VTIIEASIPPETDEETAEDVDAYVHSMLRRNDLAFRLTPDRWFLALAVGELEIAKFHTRATKLLGEINRNRIRSMLPNVCMTELGTWYTLNQSRDILLRLREILPSREMAHV
jgi:hypothetical protein